MTMQSWLHSGITNNIKPQCNVRWKFMCLKVCDRLFFVTSGDSQLVSIENFVSPAFGLRDQGFVGPQGLQHFHLDFWTSIVSWKMLKDVERLRDTLLRSFEIFWDPSQALKPRQRWRMECKRSRNQPSKYRSSSKWKKDEESGLEEWMNTEICELSCEGMTRPLCLEVQTPTKVALRWCALLEAMHHNLKGVTQNKGSGKSSRLVCLTPWCCLPSFEAPTEPIRLIPNGGAVHIIGLTDLSTSNLTIVARLFEMQGFQAAGAHAFLGCFL